MCYLLAEPMFSSPASTARKLAVRRDAQTHDVCTFESQSIYMLCSCLQVRHTTQKAGRERMWSAYHALCISEECESEWSIL